MKETSGNISSGLRANTSAVKALTPFSYMHIAGIMDIRKAGIHYYFFLLNPIWEKP